MTKSVLETLFRVNLRKASSKTRRFAATTIPLISEIDEAHFALLKKQKSAPVNLTAAGVLPYRVLPAPLLKPLVSEAAHDDVPRDDYEEARGVSLGDEHLRALIRVYLTEKKVDCTAMEVTVQPSIISTIEDMGRKDLLGSEVILMNPYFGYYNELLRSLKIRPILMRSNDPEELDKLLKKHRYVASVLISDPQTPTGLPIPRAQDIATVLNSHGEEGILAIVDSAFAHPQTFQFPLAQVGIKNLCQIFSFAKFYPSPQRYAIAFGTPAVIKPLERLGGHNDVPKDTITAILNEYPAVTEYLNKADAIMRKHIAMINSCVDAMNQLLQEVFEEPGKIFVEPLDRNPPVPCMYNLQFKGLEGHEYKGKSLKSGLQIAEMFLDVGLAVVPGECFGLEPSEMSVRLTTNHKPSTITKACELMMQSISQVSTPPKPRTSINLTLGQPVQSGRSESMSNNC